MSWGKTIWAFVIIVLVILFDFLMLRTQIFYGTNVHFVATEHSVIKAQSPSEISVVAQTVGYIRILSGNTVIKGEPETINSQKFTAHGVLSSGEWKVLNGNGDITATSENPIYLVVDESPLIWVTIIVISLICGTLFYLALALVSR
jgi:hypothetical protein